MMNKKENVELHFVIRVIFAAIPIGLLINSDDNSSGDSGMGINLMMFTGMFFLFVFGIFILFETSKFLYRKQFVLGLINLLVSIIALGILFFLGNK